jgi:hypothetical protein
VGAIGAAQPEMASTVSKQTRAIGRATFIG